jgi:hypothetical protein
MIAPSSGTGFRPTEPRVRTGLTIYSTSSDPDDSSVQDYGSPGRPPSDIVIKSPTHSSFSQPSYDPEAGLQSGLLSPTKPYTSGVTDANAGSHDDSSTMSSLGELIPVTSMITSPGATSRSKVTTPNIRPSVTQTQTGISASHTGVQSPDFSALNPTTPSKTSKLAQLAQARSQRNKLMTPSKTEATGQQVPQGISSYSASSVTTHITTTHQSLASLAEMPSSAKATSKLARKAQNARMKRKEPVETEAQSFISVEEYPMFQAQRPVSTMYSSVIRPAPPSPFASLLAEEGVITSSPPRVGLNLRPKPPDNISTSSAFSRSFAFDVPSPDDIVQNARNRTALRAGSSRN